MSVFNPCKHDARVRREACALARAGHEVLVLALAAPELPRHETTCGFRVRRIVIRSRSLPSNGLTRPIQYAEYTLRTLLAALRWGADAYHAHNANTLIVGRVAAGLRGARLVYDAHELETERNWSASALTVLGRRLWSLPERLFIRRADAIITVSDSISTHLQTLYSVRRPRTIRNMPSPPQSVDPLNLRQAIGVKSAAGLVLYQGGIKADRGIEQMIEAVTLLDDVVLILLGGGNALEPMRARVDEQGLNDQVFFLGRVPLAELPRYTAAADVGVHAIQNSCLNHYYCLPNKLFEYIQAGLPVVVSDFPEMARIVRDYEVGELVDPSDPVEIAAAIQRILSDRNYRRLQKNAVRASEVLNWEHESQRLIELYRTLEE